MSSDPDTLAAPPAPSARDEHITRSGRMLEQLKEALKTLGGAVAIALVLRSFLIEPFNIPSGSMLPKLLVGDYLFVAKWPFGYSRYSLPMGLPLWDGRVPALGGPERGDVVVFKNPADNRTDFIKRVIGLPGDQIQMQAGVLYLNGEAVPKARIDDFVVPVSDGTDCAGDFIRPSFRATVNGEVVCRFPQYRETLPGGRSYAVLDQVPNFPSDNTGVYIVPEGNYFMMGDNRDDSADSRFTIAQSGVGFVPIDNIVGRALVMWFSIDATARWYMPWTWPGALRLSRVGTTF